LISVNRCVQKDSAAETALKGQEGRSVFTDVEKEEKKEKRFGYFARCD